MVKRSVTLLQRDANYGSPYAEAGQASCDCNTKPPGRRKCEDQGQEEESKCYRREKVPPAAPKAPWKKPAHVSCMHAPTGWPRSWCWSKEQRSQPSTWHLQKLGTRQLCPPHLNFICKAQLGSSSSRDFMEVTCWEHCWSFIIQRCAAIYPFKHQPIQQEQLLPFHSELARMATSKAKEEQGISFLLHLLPWFSSFCSSTRVWHCSSTKSFQQMETPSLLHLITQHVDSIPRSYIPAVSHAGNSRLCQNLAWDKK